jgi:cation-transporting ATPase 13A1
MSQVCIKDHEVASVALYEPLPPLLRLDVLPFVFLYATGFYLYFIHPENLFVMVYFACVVFVHALAFLSSEWSLDMKCWMGYLPISNLNVNTENRTVFVKVVPTRNTLPKMLCPLFYMPKEQAVSSFILLI